MFPLLASPLAPLFVALLPAAVVWWRTRALTRRLDDPALPERLLALRSGNSAAFGFAFALLVTAWSSTVIWTLPLLVVARMAAAYPARRTLFQETWSLGTYLSFFLRLTAGIYGFWLLLSLAPDLVDAAGSYRWAVDAAIAAMLVIGNARYADIMRRLMRTTAIDDPDLTSRFARLVDASGVPAPRFERVELHGGAFANAVALPSLRRSSVIFTDALLARLDADEIVAIAAHEVAHLEHYNARRLRRTAIANHAAIAAAVAAPFVGVILPSAASSVPYVWPVIVFVMLVARSHHRQQQETNADLRAVALTGDPDALVRALTTIHTIARVPRRWAANVERQATHPSLARRIKAIREAANHPPAALGDRAAFTSTDGAASVVFGADRLEWNETAGVSFAIAYAHLTELRVDVRHKPAPRLVAVDRGGRRWELALAQADLARAQAVLDVVDGRTADLVAPAVSPRAARALAIAAAACAVTVGHVAATIVALLAAAETSAPLSAAAGCAALAAAALTLRDGAWAGADLNMPAFGLVLALVGAALLWVARGNLRDSTSRYVRICGAALAVCTVLSWLGVFAGGFDGVRLHEAARVWPAAAVLPAACAGFLFLGRSRRGRALAAAAALVALCLAAAGSRSVLEAFSDDPFVAAGEPFTVRTISPRLIAEFPVPNQTRTVHLSPTGRSIAVVSENDDEETTYHLGRAGTRLTPFAADDVVFVDDDRALMVEVGTAKGAIVREVAIGDTVAIVAERRIDDLLDARLSFDRSSDTWMVTGRTGGRQIVRVAGRDLRGAVQERRWTLPQDLAARAAAISSSEQRALVVETRYGTNLLTGRALWPWTALVGQMPPSESTVLTVDAGGAGGRVHTQLDLRCAGRGPDAASALCAAFDGVDTRFSVLESGGRVTPIARLTGRFYLYDTTGAADWATGWWQRGSILLRVSTREAFQIADASGRYVRGLSVADTVVGALILRNGTTTLGVYERP